VSELQAAFGDCEIATLQRKSVAKSLLNTGVLSASLGKNDTTLVGGTAKRAGNLEGFVAFRTRRHLARELQRVLSRPVPVQSFPIG
jgi:hypothetical protein